MKEIIYISFWFNSHWCAGALQIQNDTITYWKGDRYVNERIISINKVGADKVVKTEKTILLIDRLSVKYFQKNEKVNFWRKL